MWVLRSKDKIAEENIMRHPFDLDPSDLGVLDLDFEEQLTQEESA